jgi:hypothetical protein
MSLSFPYLLTEVTVHLAYWSSKDWPQEYLKFLYQINLSLLVAEHLCVYLCITLTFSQVINNSSLPFISYFHKISNSSKGSNFEYTHVFLSMATALYACDLSNSWQYACEFQTHIIYYSSEFPL